MSVTLTLKVLTHVLAQGPARSADHQLANAPHVSFLLKPKSLGCPEKWCLKETHLSWAREVCAATRTVIWSVKNQKCRGATNSQSCHFMTKP